MIPPQSIDAEQSVLGCIFRDQEILPGIAEIVKSTDFYREAHAIIFQAMADLYNARQPVDLITVQNKLAKDLDIIGGVTYLASLTNSMPTSVYAKNYAKIVKEKSLARQVIQKANLIMQTAYSGEYENAEELINLAESSMFELSKKNGKSSLQPVREVAFELLDDIQARGLTKGVTGVSTTFKQLDYWTAGLQPSDLIIVAGRPSMGKTSFALQIAQDGAIKNNIKSAIFSLEVRRKSLVEKMMVNNSMVDGQLVRIGKLNDEHRDKLISSANRISKTDIFIDDTPTITVPEMRSKCRKLKVEKGLDLIIIDYLQLMQGHGKSSSRQQEISEISRGLKLLARELDLPVMALSQLSRAVEQRDDKRPMLSDLRESGAIEQDADLIMFLYREEYYKPDTDKKNMVEVIIGKQRNGKVGRVELSFIKEFTKFTQLEVRPENMGNVVKGGWPV